MKYTGDLAIPITTNKLRLLASDESIKEETSRIVHARVAKLPALFAAHGVEIGDWIDLVFELAEEYVPGFRVVGPAGRPTEWSDYYKAEFKLTVDDMREANPGMKITDAIRRVQRLKSWQEKTKDMKISALSKHYYAADPRWVLVMKDAKAYDSMVKKD